MLPVREHDARERYLVLSLHRISDHYERISARLAVGHDVIWLVEISLIDILGWDKIVDFTCPRCGGRMIVIEVFARGCEPRWRPMPSRIDTS
jgi:hypothetical protein